MPFYFTFQVHKSQTTISIMNSQMNNRGDEEYWSNEEDKEDMERRIASCDRRIAIINGGGHNEVEKKLVFHSICISGIKTEKLIYTSILNPNTNKEIYKMLLAKYDELMRETYDLGGELVREDIWGEGNYVGYCKGSLDYRKYIWEVCSIEYGEEL